MSLFGKLIVHGRFDGKKELNRCTPADTSTDFELLSKTRIRNQYVVDYFERDWVRLYFGFGRSQSVRFWVFSISTSLRAVFPSLMTVLRSFRKQIVFYAFSVHITGVHFYAFYSSKGDVHTYASDDELVSV